MMIVGSGSEAGSGRPKNVFGSGSATLVLRVYKVHNLAVYRDGLSVC